MNPKEILPERIKKILIIQIAGIGDLVLATPTLRAVRERFSQSHITLLINSRAKEIIVGSAFVDEVLTLDFDKHSNFFSFLMPRNFIEILRLLKKLREKHFDMTINLFALVRIRGVIRMALLSYLIGAKYRVGRDTERRGFFLNIKVPERRKSAKHEVERNLDIARILGAEIKDKRLEIYVSEEDRRYVSDFFRQNQIADDSFVIGLNPGASIPSHLWAKEKFANLADELARRYQAKIVITGGKNEIELAGQIAGMMQVKPIIAAGRTTLKQFSVLIERCNLFIANLTGAMHMAVAVKTPLIAIVGSYTQRYLPYGYTDRSIVIKKDVSCSPCYKLRCKRHTCMKLITVEDVLQTAYKLLGNSQNRF